MIDCNRSSRLTITVAAEVTPVTWGEFFLQSTQKAWVKLVKNTQVHYTELYYRLQNEGSGDWWDLREKFLGISGYSSRMPALWFLAYFSYVNSFSMEMHTFGVIKNVMTCVMNMNILFFQKEYILVEK